MSAAPPRKGLFDRWSLLKPGGSPSNRGGPARSTSMEAERIFRDVIVRSGGSKQQDFDPYDGGAAGCGPVRQP